MRKGEQLIKIAKHLRSHRTITPIEALNLYGSFRLAARIFELRGKGWWIDTEMVEKPNGDGVYGKYWLRREPLHEQRH